MVVDLSRLDPQPAGFGRCGSCEYRDVGSAAICFACASSTLAPLPDPRCSVCDQGLKANGNCPNYVCSWSNRGFSFVRAISMMTGTLDTAIRRYKYDEMYGWAWIFGRVMVGHLDGHSGTFNRFDVIAPSPTYVGEGGRSWDHISLIVERAAVEAGGRWPFYHGDPPLIAQTASTDSFAGKKWKPRYEIATTQLRSALRIPNPAAVKGRSVLLVDDVFTTGLTTHVVGEALRDAGATEVAALVLARQPGWK
jgi:predicted amidophosphoribosyltransferase